MFHGSTKSSSIMVLQKLTLFFFLLHSFPHYCVGYICSMHIIASVWNLVSAELAGALFMLLFAWNVTKSVWSSWKWSIVIHCDQAAHPLLWLISGAHTLMIKHFVFSVMTGLIAKMLFMLLSIYNTVRWVEISECQAYWLTDFPLINKWECVKKKFI